MSYTNKDKMHPGAPVAAGYVGTLALLLINPASALVVLPLVAGALATALATSNRK